MFDVRIVYNDYRTYDVEVDDHEISQFMLAISEKKPYVRSDKTVGFWLPTENVRCAYFIKKLTQPQEEPCPKSPPLEAETASPA